jgi:hypothetical protein
MTLGVDGLADPFYSDLSRGGCVAHALGWRRKLPGAQREARGGCDDASEARRRDMWVPRC